MRSNTVIRALERTRNENLTHLGLIQIPNHRWYLVDSGWRRERTKQGRRTAARKASRPLREAAAVLTPSHLGCHSPAAKGPAAAAAGPPRRRECGCHSAWETAAGQGWGGFERAPHRSGSWPPPGAQTAGKCRCCQWRGLLRPVAHRQLGPRQAFSTADCLKIFNF
jgi:hypothetical protein